MLSIPGNARLFLYQNPVRMHKSFEGLSAEVEQAFPGELLSGAYFIFLNRIGDHMKVLFWDGDGLGIWYKRLEKGKFSSKSLRKNSISRREFFMLLEGITPQKMQKRSDYLEGVFYVFLHQYFFIFLLCFGIILSMKTLETAPLKPDENEVLTLQKNRDTPLLALPSHRNVLIMIYPGDLHRFVQFQLLSDLDEHHSYRHF